MSHFASPMTILMVEDNALQRRLLEAQIQPLGHHLIVAANGEEALARLRSDRPEPDMVIMDVVMPSMDGFKACEAIKSDPATADIPVLVLTALSRDAKDRSYTAGADDFIRKPASNLLLQMRIQTHLRVRALSLRTGPLPPARPKVLVASASSMVLTQVQNHFGKDQAIFIEAQGETQARAQIFAESPDVLVLDTDLADGSALDLVATLGQSQDLKDLPILLLHDPGELEAWSRLRGPVCDALEKPLAAPETRRRVALLARLAHLQKRVGQA
ncbi:response regulator [Geothrix terrae]|uniref:response regulator n=1 Tax=Geothrix terrae TaxID=2922720 RepID=UPI001FADD7AD|nr:response regulator [Geothrix terrae]